MLPRPSFPAAIIILVVALLAGPFFFGPRPANTMYAGRIKSVIVTGCLPSAGQVEAGTNAKRIVKHYLDHPPAALTTPGRFYAPASLTISGSAGTVSFNFDRSYLYDTHMSLAYPLSPELKQQLWGEMNRIRTDACGELVPWNEASKLFPKFAVGTVRDLETGLAFRVQRRAGSLHADIQPLTHKDTEVMRTIFGGKWSWKRRAAILEIGGKRIAASMNGMPHGAGALQKQNGFPGHSCLHFYQSRVHASGKEDPSHQLMVQKSAGLLLDTIEQADPGALTTLFFEGLRQQDPTTVLLAVLEGGNKVEEWMQRFGSQVDDVKLVSLRPENGGNDNRRCFQAELRIIPAGTSREYPLAIVVESLRPEGWNRWYICTEPILRQLDAGTIAARTHPLQTSGPFSEIIPDTSSTGINSKPSSTGTSSSAHL